MSPVIRVSLACISALALCRATSASASAATIHYDTPAADTYVSNGGTDNSQANTNFGTETSWRTRYPNHNSSNRKGYVRFDLDDRLTSTVESATLTVRYTSLTNADGTEAIVQVYGLNHDFQPAEDQLGLDWSETALTSANSPWPARGSNTIPDFVTYLGSFTISVNPAPAVGSVFSISTPELAAFLETFRLAEENNLTFIFRSTTGTFFSFASKENTTYLPTTLTVVTATSSVPEASSSAMLAGAGALAFCATTRRRVRR